MWLGLTIAMTAASPPLPTSEPPGRDVEVIGVDYAFTVPTTLPAGRTTFHFRNAGQHGHELNIFLLKRGVTIDEIILGMYKTIHIASASGAASAAVRADSAIAVDYAFRYPHEISSGRHSLAFRNDGKQRHEVLVQLLRKGVTLDSVLATEKAKGDVDTLIEDGIGVLHARGGESSLGQLNVQFLPGREYMIVCTFMDDDKSPPHYALGMYGSIRVPTKPSS